MALARELIATPYSGHSCNTDTLHPRLENPLNTRAREGVTSAKYFATRCRLKGSHRGRDLAERSNVAWYTTQADDIVYDIVNPKKLAKQRRKIDSLRQRGGIKSREVVDVAKALGRKPHPRGKEPTYVSEELPHRPPLSIPGHTELNKITAQKILDQLEADLIELEARYGT